MPDELRTVAAFSTPIEAELARGRLQAEGIQAFVADDQTVGWFWHLGVALQGVKVMVFFHGIYYRPVRRRPDGTIVPEAADEKATGQPRLAVEGDWNPDLAGAVRLARRACFAAILGVGFVPPVVTLYSCWLLLRHDLLRPEVRQQAGRFVYAAVALNAIVLATVAGLLLAVLAR